MERPRRLPVATIGTDEILGETRHQTDAGQGVCVGRPVEGIEVRIIGIFDEADRRLVRRSAGPRRHHRRDRRLGSGRPREYFNRPEATKLAKIADPARSILYHRMGDVGYRR